MATEIERKFLLRSDDWRPLVHRSQMIRQGYLCTTGQGVVRVRIRGDKGYLCVKSRVRKITRQEYEYLIPLTDADSMLSNLCNKPLIEKRRHDLFFDDILWQVDEFLAENSGLVLAEVELEDSTQNIRIPDWAGPEVSSDRRYYNDYLAQHPFASWSDK